MIEYLIYFTYTLLSLFIIVNPIEATLVFISLTSQLSAPERARMCLRTTSVAYVVAILFAVGGDLVLRLFGITVDSLRVAGGVLLFLVAVDMLRAKQNKKVTEAELKDAYDREDVTVFPLATPLLTGPGTITTVIVLMGATNSVLQKTVILGAITVTFLLTYLILRSSEFVDRILGLTGILVMTRIMGLILGAIAVGFVATGAWNIYQFLISGQGVTP